MREAVLRALHHARLDVVAQARVKAIEVREMARSHSSGSANKPSTTGASGNPSQR